MLPQKYEVFGLGPSATVALILGSPSCFLMSNLIPSFCSETAFYRRRGCWCGGGREGVVFFFFSKAGVVLVDLYLHGMWALEPLIPRYDSISHPGISGYN